MKFIERLKNLWKLSILQFDEATENEMEIMAGDQKVLLHKKGPTMKKKMATIIYDNQLEETVIDEGGEIT